MSFPLTLEQLKQQRELAKLPDCACVTTALAELFLSFPPGRRILENKRANRSGPPYIRVSRSCIRYEMGALRKWKERQTSDPADQPEEMAA